MILRHCLFLPKLFGFLGMKTAGKRFRLRIISPAAAVHAIGNDKLKMVRQSRALAGFISVWPEEAKSSGFDVFGTFQFFTLDISGLMGNITVNRS